MPVELEMVLRIVLSIVLGGLLGFQRGKAHKPAGFKDLILICSGSALVTVVSIYGFDMADQSRVAANIITGIGFLGAGVIMRRDDSKTVKGLTTAAAIWVTAGIGMSVGSGLYILAVTTTAFVFIILSLPHNLNKSE